MSGIGTAVLPQVGMLARVNAAGNQQGLLEPLAAGSGRIWADNRTKNLVLVVDVGAGTTDLSTFFVVQNVGRPGRQAYPISSSALFMAGDMLDDILVSELVSRSLGGLTGSMSSDVGADLRLRARRLKQRLFRTKTLDVTLITGETVSIELDEFLAHSKVKLFSSGVESAVSSFLDSLDDSWSRIPGQPLLVLAGGGANLPMIKALGQKRWQLGSASVVFDEVQEVPDYIATRFDADFQREYPQLAVAIGGALPVLDERKAMSKWMGGAAPGPLERVQVTGM
jgi:hypothetical protein